MGSFADRRGFLSGLAALPLIGGSVALIGKPIAAAEMMTPALLDSYDAWLFYERRFLQYERKIHPINPANVAAYPYKVRGVGFDFTPEQNAGARFHRSRTIDAEASQRAAIVLSAVGCDWRGR